MKLRSTSPKLDVRMQISLSSEHVELVKKLKPLGLSLSAYVRQALEEKITREEREEIHLRDVQAILTAPVSKPAPSVEEVNARLRALRRERVIR